LQLSTLPQTAATPAAAITAWRRWGARLPFAVLWLLPCVGLAKHWEFNPQYHFGWFVPPLALYCAWGRWQTRPAPGAPLTGGLPLAILLALALLPAWLLAQPSPDWPLLNWLLTGLVAALTLTGLGVRGGRPWLRHFFAPAALIFTAVPWPDALEGPFTQGMMRLVASVAVALLDLVGVGALQHGNLIEVASGVVGIDEACSGIRSLQGSLMASLVLGELFRFDVRRRLLLLGASLAAAFATNVLRAGFLAWSAASSGLESVHRWHDPAGFTILGLCVGLILAIALWLDRQAPPLVAPATAPSARPLPAWCVPALTLWLGAVILGTEAWFYDGAPPPANPWRVQLPAGSEPQEIPLLVRAAFHSDNATAATWHGPGAMRGLVYFFDWDFGPAFSRVTAAMHHPDLCLPATGRKLQENRGRRLFATGSAELPFQTYSFRDGDGLLFVYHGVWQVRSARAAQHGPLSPQKQIAAVQSVLWRERRVGQQSAEIILSGCRDAAQADAAFAALLPRLLVPREVAAR
jgi:exosortase